MGSISAVVATAPQDGKIQWSHKEVSPPRQPKENELLVRICAAGICHTDIFCSSLPEGALGTEYPKIYGHEGAGEVEAVGPGVTIAKVGDRVLLSYTYCAACDLCKEGKQPYCEKFGELNAAGEPTMFELSGSKACAGKFFGQSSFAALTLVDEKSVVNVQDLVQSKEDLMKYAPLGCGLMTGAGAVLGNVKSHDILVVTGVGAVGAAAIMTGKIIGCKAIIAVDRIESRLAVAKELGATHTYDTSKGGDMVADIQALVDGQRISYAIDTTGVTSVMEKALQSLGKRGKLIQIGVPNFEDSVTLSMADFFFQNKVFEINYLGDSSSREMVPKMIEWHKEGKFPFEKLIKFYAVKDVQTALEEMKAEVVKPVLTF